MHHFLIVGGLAMMFCSPAMSGVHDLVCDVDGMAGVYFGGPLDQKNSTLVERTEAGAKYFLVEPRVNLSPYTRLIVGVLPDTGNVFSIRLELSVDTTQAQSNLEHTKALISSSHLDVKWNVIGNHHHAEDLDGLDLVVYWIGNIVDGEAGALLAYDCDNIEVRRSLFRSNGASGIFRQGVDGATPNQSLQRPFDPPGTFAVAKARVASNAAELRR